MKRRTALFFGILAILFAGGCQKARGLDVPQSAKAPSEGKQKLDAYSPQTTQTPPSPLQESTLCGEVSLPDGDGNSWHCIGDQWTCVAESCRCGSRKTGKYGKCLDGIPTCSGQKLDALKEEGYVCQGGAYQCMNPTGCQCGGADCPQFAKCIDGKCEYRKKSSDKIPVLCKEGNCKCGNGACAKDAYCFDGICVCGRPDYKDEEESFDDGYIISNHFGEFSCRLVSSESHRSGDNDWNHVDYSYTMTCERPEGCMLDGERRPTTQNGECYFYYELLDDHEYCNYASEHDDDPDDKAREAIRESFNAFFLLHQCGRETATGFALAPHDDGFPDVDESNRFACQQRNLCDTMPVPRKDRSRYTCDVLKKVYKDGYLEDWYDFNHYEYDVIGLRCNDESGCPCFDDTCAKGQLCHRGTCVYDDVYASNLCKNFLKDIDYEKLLSLHDDGIVLTDGFFTFDYETQRIIMVSEEEASDSFSWAETGHSEKVDSETGKPLPPDIDSDDYEGSVQISCFRPPEPKDQYGVIERIAAATSVRTLWERSKDMSEFEHYCGSDPGFYGPPYTHSLETPFDGFSNHYHANTAGIHITPWGECICGRSYYTPEIDGEYICEPNYGYICAAEKDCKCGDVRCKRGSYCLHPGVCADS